MKIIVFHTSTYNENDLIVDAIKEDGVVSFKIRGGASATNPFIWLNNPLTVAEVEFVEPNKYKHPVLLRADLISSPQNVALSLEQVLVINVVSEIIFKMIDDDDKSALFEDILNFLTAFKKGDLDLYTLLLIFVAKAIKVSGFELEVNQCVNCGSKKDIVNEQRKSEILRFANRVPLTFDQGSCAITEALKSIDWRRYGLRDLDNTPLTLFVNIVYKIMLIVI